MYTGSNIKKQTIVADYMNERRDFVMEKAKNEEFTVYLSLDASTMVTSKQVHIEDIASVFCSKPDIMHAVKKIKLYTFHDNEQGQIVIHTLAIIAEILKYDTSVTVQNIGSEACVVYYRNLSDGHKRSGKIKAAFLMLLAFFGTAYSIMSYNGDVGAVSLLQDLYFMFTGLPAGSMDTGYKFGILFYCAGLFFGMLVFFNHGFNHKKTDDPTPLQVQMRLYEQDVNDAIIIDSEREGTGRDVD